MRKSMLIGALSLVIVVWLGTSMNCSRRSARTGRSTIGMRKMSPGPRTRLSSVRPPAVIGRFDDDRQALLTDDAHRRAPLQRPFARGAGAPFLAGHVDRADRQPGGAGPGGGARGEGRA